MATNSPRILMVASEAGPWAKSGGLADVTAALPVALARLGHPVGVVIPLYMNARDAPSQLAFSSLPIPLGGRIYEIAIRTYDSQGVTLFFIEHAGLYDRPGLYGDANGDFPDNHIRFAVLSKAALEVSRRLFRADILHCHDWQAALVPVYLRNSAAVDPNFLGVKTLLTIHNLGYQGIFSPPGLAEIDLPSHLFHPDALEFWGNLNFLKGGIIFADALSTVSSRYAKEIQTPEYGFGLDGLLRTRSSDLTGILNGVDYSQWNPETDTFIPARYSVNDLSGKRICKREVLREFGLPDRASERPLLGIVSRFTGQKGFDLIAEAAPGIFRDDLYLIALGSGEPEWEDLFRHLQSEFPSRISVQFGYDDAVAHRIEAGADIFLMPSRYEPCGLNQIYSLRYGTVPVVRATGGLDDTITDSEVDDVPENKTTGFKFPDYDAAALARAIRRACRRLENRGAWRNIILRGMRQDFSWAASAKEYSRLYGRLNSRV